MSIHTDKCHRCEDFLQLSANSSLEATWMADIVAFESSALGLPAWSCRIPCAPSIKAETTNFHEDVAFTNVNSNVIAVAFFSVIKKLLRDERSTIELSSFMENVGDGSGAIVARVIVASVPAPVFVGFAD